MRNGKKEFERFDLTPETILVGHSCGGGFLVRYLSEHKELKVGTVVLVAPWINPDNYAVSDTADFFSFEIDRYFPSRAKSVTIFISSDDKPSVIKTVDILKEEVDGLKLKEYTDKGHFKFNDLPELLEYYRTELLKETASQPPRDKPGGKRTIAEDSRVG